MAAITADNVNFMQSKLLSPDGMYVDAPVAATTVIYKHSLVGLNTAGYLVSYVPWAQAATPTGTPLLGIAVEHVASQTSAGDKTARVMVQGFFEYALGSAVIADVGKPVFALDNATLTKIASNNEPVGRIIGLASAGNIVVELASPTIRSGWIGGMKTVVREIDFDGTVNDEVYLLHETENHNGVLLYSINGYVTEQHECSATAGVVTVMHTIGTDTTMGCILTAINDGPIGDLDIGAGGCVIEGAATASADNLVIAPADKGIVAKLTTVNVDAGAEAGKEKLIATFVAL